MEVVDYQFEARELATGDVSRRSSITVGEPGSVLSGGEPIGEA